MAQKTLTKMLGENPRNEKLKDKTIDDLPKLINSMTFEDIVKLNINSSIDNVQKIFEIYNNSSVIGSDDADCLTKKEKFHIYTRLLLLTRIESPGVFNEDSLKNIFARIAKSLELKEYFTGEGYIHTLTYMPDITMAYMNNKSIDVTSEENVNMFLNKIEEACKAVKTSAKNGSANQINLKDYELNNKKVDLNSYFKEQFDLKYVIDKLNKAFETLRIPTMKEPQIAAFKRETVSALADVSDIIIKHLKNIKNCINGAEEYFLQENVDSNFNKDTFKTKLEAVSKRPSDIKGETFEEIVRNILINLGTDNNAENTTKRSTRP